MSNPPVGKSVNCPECNALVFAIIPQGSTIVERETKADGKAWVNCHACGNRFLIHYRTD